MRNETMNEIKCIAVIGGIDYEGEQFSTLRLFDCHSAADAYELELSNQLGIDYVLKEVRVIDQRSVVMGA